MCTEYCQQLLNTVRHNDIDKARNALTSGAQVNCEYYSQPLCTGFFYQYKYYLPLHWAAKNYNPDMVELLLLYGADPALTDYKGRAAQVVLQTKIPDLPHQVMPDIHEQDQALLRAASVGNIDGVTQVLLDGVNINCLGPFLGFSALHWAAKNHHLEMIELLLLHGADPALTDYKGRTAENIIKIKIPGLRPNGDDPFYDLGNILLKTASIGDINGVKQALQDKANVNYCGPFLRFNALHWAVYNNNLQLTILLRDYGADPLVKDGNKKTPQEICEDNTSPIYNEITDTLAAEQRLVAAAQRNETQEVINILNTRSCKYLNYQPCKNGKSAIHYAVKNTNVKMTVALLEFNANFYQYDNATWNTLDMNREFALLFTSDSQVLEYVTVTNNFIDDLFISAVAFLYFYESQENSKGKKCMREVVKQAITLGANVNCNNKDEQTALDMAVLHQDRKLIRLLLSQSELETTVRANAFQMASTCKFKEILTLFETYIPFENVTTNNTLSTSSADSTPQFDFPRSLRSPRDKLRKQAILTRSFKALEENPHHPSHSQGSLSRNGSWYSVGSSGSQQSSSRSDSPVSNSTHSDSLFSSTSSNPSCNAKQPGSSLESEQEVLYEFDSDDSSSFDGKHLDANTLAKLQDSLPRNPYGIPTESSMSCQYTPRNPDTAATSMDSYDSEDFDCDEAAKKILEPYWLYCEAIFENHNSLFVDAKLSKSSKEVISYFMLAIVTKIYLPNNAEESLELNHVAFAKASNYMVYFIFFIEYLTTNGRSNELKTNDLGAIFTALLINLLLKFDSKCDNKNNVTARLKKGICARFFMGDETDSDYQHYATEIETCLSSYEAIIAEEEFQSKIAKKDFLKTYREKYSNYSLERMHSESVANSSCSRGSSLLFPVDPNDFRYPN